MVFLILVLTFFKYSHSQLSRDSVYAKVYKKSSKPAEPAYIEEIIFTSDSTYQYSYQVTELVLSFFIIEGKYELRNNHIVLHDFVLNPERYLKKKSGNRKDKKMYVIKGEICENKNCPDSSNGIFTLKYPIDR